MTRADERPITEFAHPDAFRLWLTEHHSDHPGIWMKIAKKGSEASTVTYADALDIALAFGWIDGQKRPLDADFYLQAFTRRRAQSVWSRRNIEKASAMIAAGDMTPAGLAQVAAAKADGRWERAYAGSTEAQPPPEFLAALDRNPAAKDFYATLNAVNRYAIYYRIHNVKREDTRARKIATFVEMLARGEKLH